MEFESKSINLPLDDHFWWEVSETFRQQLGQYSSSVVRVRFLVEDINGAEQGGVDKRGLGVARLEGGRELVFEDVDECVQTLAVRITKRLAVMVTRYAENAQQSSKPIQSGLATAA